MKVSSRSVLGFALVLNGVIAAPLNPRNIEVVTVTEVTTEVVRYTTTHWVDPTPGPGYGPHGGDEDHDDDIPTTSSTTTSTPTTTTTTTPTPTPPPAAPLTTPTTTSTPAPPPPPPAVKVPTTTEVPTTPPAPVPTTPAAVPTTTAPAPPPANNPPPPSYGGTGGGSSETFSGDGTYYDTGMGSCGIQSTDNDLIVAISKELMDAQYTPNPNNNPLCGKKILCSYKGGAEVLLTVTDRCEGCKKPDLDLSPAAFAAIGAPKAAGRVPITWRWA